MNTPCPFCPPPASDIVIQNTLCFARYDRYPLGKGHLLIIPHRHVASFFALTDEEQRAAWELLGHGRAKLDAGFHPDGYNIGVNVGEPAGQTIPHAHIHLIPRYKGDVLDPRGGVRWVVPEKAPYWTEL